MRLCGKCVKVIDSDITEDTCWSKCYSYVITKDINILNNVKLTIQDGAGVYLYLILIILNITAVVLFLMLALNYALVIYLSYQLY
jgi:hypothetical protein